MAQLQKVLLSLSNSSCKRVGWESEVEVDNCNTLSKPPSTTIVQYPSSPFITNFILPSYDSLVLDSSKHHHATAHLPPSLAPYLCVDADSIRTCGIMDAAALATLLSESTQKLVGLHSQIGHPPEALQGALDALHQALKTAVDDQISKVQKEAQDLSAECARIEADNSHIKRALGEKSHASNPSLQNAIGKRMVSAASPPTSTADSGSCEAQPLLQRFSQLQIEQTRLKASYTAKEAQLDRLAAKLQTYVPLLGTFVKVPEDSAQDYTIDAASAAAAFRDVSQPRIASFEAEIIRCSKEVNARSEKLQTSLLEIVQLWSELYLEPGQPAALSDDHVFDSHQAGEEVDCGGGTLGFDRAILAHLQLEPIHDEETRKFVGEFVSTEQPERRDAAATRGSQAIDEILRKHQHGHPWVDCQQGTAVTWPCNSLRQARLHLFPHALLISSNHPRST